jgi:hypothetical protein
VNYCTADASAGTCSEPPAHSMTDQHISATPYAFSHAVRWTSALTKGLTPPFGVLLCMLMSVAAQWHAGLACHRGCMHADSHQATLAVAGCSLKRHTVCAEERAVRLIDMNCVFRPAQGCRSADRETTALIAAIISYYASCKRLVPSLMPHHGMSDSAGGLCIWINGGALVAPVGLFLCAVTW